MEKVDEAVNNFSQQLEAAIAPGVSFKQFISLSQSIEESVILDLGDSALDHFIHKKFREQIGTCRSRLQKVCEERYISRCRDAYKNLFSGPDDRRQTVFDRHAQYTKDPSCIAQDWDQWCDQYLNACGNEQSSLGEECRVLLEAFKSSAVQMLTNVNSEFREHSDQLKHSYLKVHGQLDERILEIARLQGEKDNSIATCRSLECRLLELQQLQGNQVDTIRDLQNRLMESELHAKRCQEENETTRMKYEKMVARLVAKTKECSALVSQRDVAITENEVLKRQQRYDSERGKKGKKSGNKVNKNNDFVDIGEVDVQRELNMTLSKRIAELQDQLDYISTQYESVVESEKCAEKLMVTDQEKMDLLRSSLEIKTRELTESALRCSKLEGEINTKEVECRSRDNLLHEWEVRYKNDITKLFNKGEEEKEELTKELSLLKSHIASGKKVLAETLSENQRLSQELSEQSQTQVPEQSLEGDSITKSSKNQNSASSGSTLDLQLCEAREQLQEMQETLRCEKEALTKKLNSTVQSAQSRINELDMAYFRVEAELKMKAEEAKRYFDKVKQLEEEVSTLDRLRRKAELNLDTEAQKRSIVQKDVIAFQKDVDTLSKSLSETRSELSDLVRNHEILKMSNAATLEEKLALEDKISELKATTTKLRQECRGRNDLEFAVSELTRERDILSDRVDELEREVIELRPLKDTEAKLKEDLRCVKEKEEKCDIIISQFDDIDNANKLLSDENSALEEQLETLSNAFERRGQLLQDLERRLDVSSSDCAYHRSENSKAREQVRELGEKVQTLMANYNEASSQNEEKSFALLQLNGQHHELQSNLSQVAAELTELRDLPQKLSKLEEEHSKTKAKLVETLATLDELSLLSAKELEEKDHIVKEIEHKHKVLSEEHEVLSRKYDDLSSTHKDVMTEKDALFLAFTTLDNKLSNIEAEIME